MTEKLAKAVYTCVYVEPHKVLEAYKGLLEAGVKLPALPKGLEGVCCNHMTIKFRPTKDDVCKLPMGGAADLEITGYAHDKDCIALRVKQVYGYPVPSDNEVPHITFWVSEGTPPYYSNELLGAGVTEIENPPRVSGRVGYCTGSDYKFDYEGSVYVHTSTF
tara:strand:- start:1304 stop:1789 length:486 start_codon:yes stop_codon:yes gene_type:complete